MKARLLTLGIATVALGLLSRAASIYWDGGFTNITTNGDGASQGGSGTWDSAVKNWDAGSGRAHVAPAKRHTAVFGGTAGTVTVNGTNTITGIVFASDGYILNGSNTLTIKSQGITANGSTTINAPLRVFSAQTWTAASGKELTITGTVNTNGRALTFGGAGNTSVTGVISGTGRLIKSGSGTLTLAGANTYTGTTTLAGGVVNLGAAENPGTSGPLGRATAAGSILFTGGTLQYSAANAADYSGRFSTGGSQIWNIDTNGRNVTYGTALTGAGSSLTKLGAGTLTLSGANTYTGGTTIQNGGLNVTGTLADTGTVNVNGGTYTVGTSDTVGALTLANGTINGAGTLTASSYTVQNGSISTALAGTGGLTKTTAGSVTLSGANTFTGGTTIQGGVLNVTGTLSDTGTVNVNGGTYTVGSSDTIGALTLTNGTINGSGVLTAPSYAVQNGTISAVLAGSGGMTKSTGGAVSLFGANTFTGPTAINAGTLTVDGALSGSSAVSLASGAVLGGIGTVGNVTVANGTAVILANRSDGRLTTNNLTFLGSGTIEIGTLSNYTAAPALSVTGNLTLAGAAGAVSLALPAGTVSAGTYHLIGNTLSNLAGFLLTGENLGVRQSSQLVTNGSFIDYVVSGANPYWTGALSSEWSTAVLSAPKNWALSPSQTTDFITNDAVLFDDRATTTTVNIAANVSPTVVSFDHSAKNYTLQGSAGIATGALTKSGTGTLTITNANSFAGNTTLYSGTLRIGNNSALGTGNLIIESGTVSSDSTTARTLANNVILKGDATLGSATQTGRLTFTGTLGLDGFLRQVTTASDVEFSGTVSNGGLTKAGAGMLALSGPNTYSGGTVIQAGAIAVNSATSLGSGGLSFTGNGTLFFNTGFASARGFSIAGGASATVDTNGTNASESGVISGAGSLTKTGLGTYTISGANTYGGVTTITAGTLAAAGGNAISDGGSVVLTDGSGAALRLDSNETIGSLAGGAGGGRVDLQANQLTVAGSANTGFAGEITGTGTLVKTGTGILTLSGINTYSGSTTLTAGSLAIQADSGLGAAPGASTAGSLIFNGGTLASTQTFTLASTRGITTGGTIETAADTTLTYAGVAAGTGSLTKTGDGTLVLAGANTYTGATVVSQGVLAINGQLNASSAVSVAGDAILAGTGSVLGSVTADDNGIIRAGNGTSGSLSIGGSLTFAGDGVFEIGNLANYTTTAAIQLTGSLSVQSGALIDINLPSALVTNGTYHLISHSNNLNSVWSSFAVSGPIIGGRQSATLDNNSGMIDYVVAGDTPYWTGAASGEWNTSAINWKLITAGTNTTFLANDAVLFNDNATGTTTVNIAADVNPAVVSFANSAKDYTLQGPAGIATGALSKSGTGTLTIHNANSYAGGTTLSSGTLRIGNNNALGTGLLTISGGSLSSSSSSARTLSNSIAVAGDFTLGHATFNGEITLTGGVDLSDANRQVTVLSNATLQGNLTHGGLTKAGAAKLTLSGNNTYVGPTSVTAGQLVVNGSLANSGLLVANTATLGGTGTIAGTTTIQGGGTLAPGNGVGILSVTDLAFLASANLRLEIDQTQSQLRGLGYDGINAVGSFTGSGAILQIAVNDVDFSSPFWTAPHVWSDIVTTGASPTANWTAAFSAIQVFNSNGDLFSPSNGGFSISGNSLAWNPVPEPSTGMIGMALAAATCLRRRRSK